MSLRCALHPIQREIDLVGGGAIVRIKVRGGQEVQSGEGTNQIISPFRRTSYDLVNTIFFGTFTDFYWVLWHVSL